MTRATPAASPEVADARRREAELRAALAAVQARKRAAAAEFDAAIAAGRRPPPAEMEVQLGVDGCLASIAVSVWQAESLLRGELRRAQERLLSLGQWVGFGV